MKIVKLFLSFFLLFSLCSYKNYLARFVLSYDYVIPSKTEEQLTERIKKIKELLPEGETREKVINNILTDNKPVIFNKKLVCEGKKALYINKTVQTFPMKVGEQDIFFDMEKREFLAQSYILNKPFIVKKEIDKLNWEYFNELKQIGAFKAKKAIAKKDTIFFAEVWYTEDLPAFPIENLYGIKGGVVEATFAEGQQLKLKSFTTILSKEDIIEKPSKGKNISEKEYKLLEEQKIKEVNEHAKNNIKN